MKKVPKITYEEFQKMLRDPEVPESKIAPYIVVDEKESGPLSPVLKPNRKLVKMTQEEVEAENAMKIGNSTSRWRRQRRFNSKRRAGSKLPVLVSEGDSWFQFPILVDDVIDHLGKDYLVWSTGAAGDTAQNMINGPISTGKTEYMIALKQLERSVKAFLFSGAGNDIIGEDINGNPVIGKLLKKFHAGGNAASHVNHAAVADVLRVLRKSYQKLIDNVRSRPKLKKLPIIIHGYDYAIPGSKKDSRNPIYAAPDEWLGKPMASLGIKNEKLQRDIVKILIDALYDMLFDLERGNPHVHVVDVRGTLTQKSHWNDEIHATSNKFADVAKKFKTQIRKVI